MNIITNNSQVPYRECRTCKTMRHPEDFGSALGKCSFCRRERYLERNYGVSGQRLHELLLKQYSECAICGVLLDRLTAIVDHDHSCCPTTPTCGNCNRGLLCVTCNNGLGMFHDNPAHLAAAIEYLK